MCSFFGISRAAYYKWLKRSQDPDPDRKGMDLVKEAWLRSRRTYGYRRIAIALQQQGHAITTRLFCA
ncbi:MAG: transposase [Anaerolineae bacterium]|nr:transposase [Anaerolineae bacterium]MBT7073159.1 transposase [Anaerolineae bacterium]MBT7326615.1 transposase [Anaerolineae bacterium]